jgi:hypothetical protein
MQTEMDTKKAKLTLLALLALERFLLQILKSGLLSRVIKFLGSMRYCYKQAQAFGLNLIKSVSSSKFFAT